MLRHGEVTCLHPGQWHSWSQGLSWEQESKPGLFMICWHPRFAHALPPLPSHQSQWPWKLSKESVPGCNCKCQDRRGSGKSWTGRQRAAAQSQHSLHQHTHVLSILDSQHHAFVTSSGIHELDAYCKPSNWTTSKISQALFSTAVINLPAFLFPLPVPGQQIHCNASY